MFSLVMFCICRMPRFYSNKMQRKMEVGAGCEDLRARCPQFYEVAYKLYEATGDAGLGNFVNNTFRARYKVALLANDGGRTRIFLLCPCK